MSNRKYIAAAGLLAAACLGLGGIAGVGGTLVYQRLQPVTSIRMDGSVSSATLQKFNDIRGALHQYYYKDVNDEALMEGAIGGMAEALKDPYTVYFTKDQMKSFSERTEGSYVGIGVSVALDADGILTIMEPFEDSPAIKAGLKKGDKITKVDGEDVTAIKDDQMIISKIKGKEGTPVKITVYRPDEKRPIDFALVRKKIKIANSKSEMLEGQIGYIRLISFDQDIYADFTNHLNKLLAQGMKGLVIDVRDNPGGSYENVVKICDRLLPEGLIVYTEDKAGKKEEKRSDAQSLNLPMVVLTNENSASASEILSAALHDNKKATLIGTKTFGKGLVQTVLPLQDGSGLKVTISRYFTPAGVCIQGDGIKPDQEVKLDEKYAQSAVSQIPREDDVQLRKGREQILTQIKN